MPGTRCPATLSHHPAYGQYGQGVRSLPLYIVNQVVIARMLIPERFLYSHNVLDMAQRSDGVRFDVAGNRDGMLYSMIGRAVAAAIAEKCSTRAL